MNPEGKFIIDSEGTKTWLNEKNEIHREDGPAVVWEDGSKEYWLNGKRHREDGPAIVRSEGLETWWLNGKRHRENGPAIVWANGYKEYWLNDEWLTEKEFLKKMEEKRNSITNQLFLFEGYSE